MATQYIYQSEEFPEKNKTWEIPPNDPMSSVRTDTAEIG
jgi:hypothetical protein